MRCLKPSTSDADRPAFQAGSAYGLPSAESSRKAAAWMASTAHWSTDSVLASARVASIASSTSHSRKRASVMLSASAWNTEVA